MACYYYARGSLAKLWRAYFQYGYFKPLVVRKVRGILTIRQIVPATFVATLFLTGALAWWSVPMRWACVGILTTYTAAVVWQAGWRLPASGVACAMALCAVFPVIHLSYGLGWLRGIVDWWLRPRGRRPGAETVPLSR